MIDEAGAPVWGKRFGLATRKRVGRVGTLTVEKAKECLEKESFGFRMAEAVDVPPLIELRYGEVHNECASVTIVAGLSELHLSHKENIQDVHYMLMGLGYVSYTPVDQDQTGEEVPRFWGEGISTSPSKHYAGDGGAVSIKQQGPTYYTWHYRLPPFVEGLAMEGEAGDPRGGPERYNCLKKLELQQENKKNARRHGARRQAPKRPGTGTLSDGEVDPRRERSSTRRGRARRVAMRARRRPRMYPPFPPLPRLTPPAGAACSSRPGTNCLAKPVVGHRLARHHDNVNQG